MRVVEVQFEPLSSGYGNEPDKILHIIAHTLDKKEYQIKNAAAPMFLLYKTRLYKKIDCLIEHHKSYSAELPGESFVIEYDEEGFSKVALVME